MSGKTLLDKVWDLHKIATLDTGGDQLFIGLHLIHEVTSPQAFQMLKDKNIKVKYPDRTFATVDHIIPTDDISRPLKDRFAEEMLLAIERNTSENKINFFNLNTSNQGIVHLIGPELGLTQPGMTIACGDSHTSTHGAFGAIAFGVGTSQIRDIFASQSLSLSKPKIRKIYVKGDLPKGVYAKDIILKIISDLGVRGGIGYAYEYTGPIINKLSMEERMTICNMSIEGGARFGYINPDDKTFAYIKDRKYAPKGDEYKKAEIFWESLSSDADAFYDDEYILDVSDLAPMVTWGINPGQGMQITENMPYIKKMDTDNQESAQKAYLHMGFKEGQFLKGQKIDRVFIGSCTNGRISDLRIAAKLIKDKKVSSHVNAMVVPGSKQVQKQAEEEGLSEIFTQAGIEWRNAGCSMCLAMNPDKLTGSQICASSSNRNFIGRQGSPKGRTILMSPAMAAGAAIAGELVDIREWL